jgi:hypothetical protein
MESLILAQRRRIVKTRSRGPRAFTGALTREFHAPRVL